MASQKEQKLSTGRNKNKSDLSTIVMRKDMEGLHFKEICSFILSKMGLEFDKEYKLKEIVDKIVESGNNISYVNGKKFDADFYYGIKDKFDSKFQMKTIGKILLESPEEFEEVLNELDNTDTITGVEIFRSSKEKEELVKLIGKSLFPIVIINIPY